MLFVGLFLFGLFVGSFLNVIIDRIPRGETILKGRSHCEYCQHVLHWHDLIPVISFLILSGKCRYCKKFIGYRYPIIELSTGFLFSLTFLLSQNLTIGSQLLTAKSLVYLLYYLFLVSCLIVIFFIDFFNGIIPDVVLLPLGIVSLVYAMFSDIHLLPQKIISAITAFSFFIFLVLITKGKGMGLGDVKLVFVMGIILGFPGIFLSLYIAFLTGAVISLALMFLKRKKLKSTIAFGPFLVFGTFISLLYGEILWKMLLKFFS